MSLTSASADYRDNSFRSKMTIVALLLIAFTASVSALLYFEEARLWKAFNELDDFAEDRLDSLLLIQGLMGIFYFLLNILTIVFFLMWFRRAYANLGRLGVKHLDHEDSMAVWGFFIPFVNLYRPFQIARETATEVNSLLDKLIEGPAGKIPIWIVSLWWALFWIRNFLDNLAFRAMMKDITVSDKIHAAEMGCISDIFTVPAALMAAWMVHVFSKSESLIFHKLQSLTN